MDTDFFFPQMSERRLDLPDFCNTAEFILFLPGHTASVKRMYYIKNTMWSKEKSRQSAETMRDNFNCVFTLCMDIM
jgi:hypothetical protein